MEIKWQDHIHMKNLILLVLSISFMWSCYNKEKQPLSKKQQARHRVDSLENLFAQSLQNSEKLDIKLAMYTIQAYEYYAADYPQDANSPLYLSKAAQNYHNILLDYKKAIKIYEHIYNHYPQYNNRSMMLFLQGSAYHELQDTTNAINKLKLFIKSYPGHDFADDAEGLIRFMRLSEEELDEFFGKKKMQ